MFYADLERILGLRGKERLSYDHDQPGKGQGNPVAVPREGVVYPWGAGHGYRNNRDSEPRGKVGRPRFGKKSWAPWPVGGERNGVAFFKKPKQMDGRFRAFDSPDALDKIAAKHPSRGFQQFGAHAPRNHKINALRPEKSGDEELVVMPAGQDRAFGEAILERFSRFLEPYDPERSNVALVEPNSDPGERSKPLGEVAALLLILIPYAHAIS